MGVVLSFAQYQTRCRGKAGLWGVWEAWCALVFSCLTISGLILSELSCAVDFGFG